MATASAILVSLALSAKTIRTPSILCTCELKVAMSALQVTTAPRVHPNLHHAQLERLERQRKAHLLQTALPALVILTTTKLDRSLASSVDEDQLESRATTTRAASALVTSGSGASQIISASASQGLSSLLPLQSKDPHRPQPRTAYQMLRRHALLVSTTTPMRKHVCRIRFANRLVSAMNRVTLRATTVNQPRNACARMLPAQLMPSVMPLAEQTFSKLISPTLVRYVCKQARKGSATTRPCSVRACSSMA